MNRSALDLWRRANDARRQRRISYGALAYLRNAMRLAKARGDGRSFVLGERVQEAILAMPRRSIQRWRAQLVAAGLLSFTAQWAHKKGWFWEARTELHMHPLDTQKPAPTGDKLSPVKQGNLLATKRSQHTGDNLKPSLIGNGIPVEPGKKDDGCGLRPGAERPASGTAKAGDPAGTRKGKAAVSEEGGTPPPVNSDTDQTNDGKGVNPPGGLPPQVEAELRHVMARNADKTSDEHPRSGRADLTPAETEFLQRLQALKIKLKDL